MKRIAYTVEDILSAIEGSHIVDINPEKTRIKKKGLVVLGASKFAQKII
jgi:hypothetical protein